MVTLIDFIFANDQSYFLIQFLRLVLGAGAPVDTPVPGQAPLLPVHQLLEHHGHLPCDVGLAVLGGVKLLATCVPGVQVLRPLGDGFIVGEVIQSPIHTIVALTPPFKIKFLNN